MARKKRKSGNQPTKTNPTVAQVAKARHPNTQKSPTLESKSRHPRTKGVASPSRRTLIKSAGLIGVALVGGAAIHTYDSRNRTLHDLSVVGQGKPVVLQVHDPSCALCRQLKRSTLTALETRPDITYRIADLGTTEGKAYADRFGVGKVTLLLFDGLGKRVATVQGVKPAEELRETFAQSF